MSEKLVDIGYLEKSNPWTLHPRFFPSKVGGKPSWLNFKDLPSTSDLLCKICHEPLIFLCQIYAPIEEKHECFHRMIFIFICKKGSCCTPNVTDNLKVFRCQMNRDNEFFSYEPAKEDEAEIFDMSQWPPLCSLCGARGPAHCAKCKSVNYCHRSHQVTDWQKHHKQNCGNITKSINHDAFCMSEASKSFLFPEWELLVEEESEEEKTVVNLETEMDKYKSLCGEKSGTLSDVSDKELEQYVSGQAPDKSFAKFNKRIARHPDQVLRYDRNGQPLWITSQPMVETEHVPNCSYCGVKRQFEFQIMPQLLNFLDLTLDVISIDWGVLAIYTCAESCSGGPAYKAEYIFKQDIARENK